MASCERAERNDFALGVAEAIENEVHQGSCVALASTLRLGFDVGDRDNPISFGEVGEAHQFAVDV